MAFWRCYYHIIWATKNRSLWITPQIERVIFATIREKASELETEILAINSVSDHIHAAVCIPPKLSVAEWVKQMKGTSTRDINRQFPDLETSFSWQQSYGVLTFGAKHSKFVVNYVESQKEHHANQTLEPYLEQIDDDT
ncbi:MAG: IS200/IS605 family transposase [Chloroflexota bacterium]